MTKAVTFLATLFLSVSLCAAEGFNLSLSFAVNAPTEGRSTEKPQPLLYGSDKIGKFIKDRLIGEGDYRIKTIVIDPGHGGHDPGCLGGHSQEKHIALALGLKLAAAMRQQYPELRVLLTRDTDVFIPLHERAAIANRNSADLFISIHCNYMPGSSATHGSETYVMGLHTAEHNLKVAKRENAAILLEEDYEANYDYDPNSAEGHIMLNMFQSAYLEQSIRFAEKVEQRFALANRKSRGVKQAGFVVLKETTMPSVLVETGFLSNRAEEAYLMTEEGQQTVAHAMLSAFEEYRRELEGRLNVSPLAAEPPSEIRPEAYSPPIANRTESRGVPPEAQTQPPPPPRPSPGDEASRSRQTQPQPKVQVEPAPQARPQFTSRADEEQTTVAPERKIISLQPQAAAPTTEPRRINERPTAEDLSFHVQLVATSKPVDTSHPRWNNTGYLIEVVQEGQLFKYQARNFKSLEQASQAQAFLKERGFQDAFVVAYRNGQRLSMEEVRQILGY